MGFLTAILPILGNVFANVAASLFPDPADKLKAQELQNQLRLAIIQQASVLEQAAADNVKAEIQGTSWLQKNWRPILMMTFGGLIVARWFGYTAPDMSPSEAIELWSIVKLGLGGYTIGRTAEKIAPVAIKAIKSK